MFTEESENESADDDTSLGAEEIEPSGIMIDRSTLFAGRVFEDDPSCFMQLCQAHGLPMVSLCDTPGFMVGPDAEQQGTVRHVSRMFVSAASLSIPFFTVVLRKGYGLGAMAMAGGDLHAPVLTVAWPTGEFGGMGLEGAVRLGFRDELAAITDETARRARYDELVAGYYERGKALGVATVFEIDDVIDPADTRAVVSRALRGR